jgi:hypothetical protein
MKRVVLLVSAIFFIAGCSSKIPTAKVEPKEVNRGKICITRVDKKLIEVTYSVDKLNCKNINLDIAQSTGIVEFTTTAKCLNSAYIPFVTKKRKFYLNDIYNIKLDWNGQPIGALPKVGITRCFNK